MSDLDKNLGENNIEHVKKHDHSVLGKHTKDDKQKYLEELMDNTSSKPEEKITDKKPGSNKKNKEEHVKKDDHSFLGKHTPEEKQRYLESLKKNEKPKVSNEGHTKKDDHSFLGKHTPAEKQAYLENLVDKKKEPLIETTPVVEPPETQKNVVKKKRSRQSRLFR